MARGLVFAAAAFGIAAAAALPLSEGGAAGPLSGALPPTLPSEAGFAQLLTDAKNSPAVESKPEFVSYTSYPTRSPSTSRTVTISYVENYLAVLAWAVGQLIIGLIITNSVMQKPSMMQQPMQPGRGFPDGVCNCLSDSDTCVWGWCCPMVRAARSAHEGGFMTYHQALAIAFLGYLLGWGFLFVVFFFRLQLRRRAGLMDSPVLDCLQSCFCTSCVLCQDARFVKMATSTVQPVSVGMPVYVQGGSYQGPGVVQGGYPQMGGYPQQQGIAMAAFPQQHQQGVAMAAYPQQATAMPAYPQPVATHPAPTPAGIQGMVDTAPSAPPGNM